MNKGNEEQGRRIDKLFKGNRAMSRILRNQITRNHTEDIKEKKACQKGKQEAASLQPI